MHQSAVKIYSLFLLLSISMTGWAQKTDKVFLKNGDVLTGEIKYMKFAKLNYDVTGPGKIDVKWEEIVKIQSAKTFQITMRNGAVWVISLDSLFLNAQFLTLDHIVEIVRIKDKFLQRLDGTVDLGFSFAKANSNLKSNFSSTVTYRRPKNELSLKLNSVLSNSSTDTIVTKKQDAALTYLKTLRKHYYVDAAVAWQENTELGLNNRYLVTAGTGKILFNNNRRRFLTGAGLSINREQFSGNINYKDNLEALAGFEYKEFRYSRPKISIDVKFTIFPGLSDWGRVRMDFNLSAKIEILKDFNVGLSFYDVFDNRPSSASSTKNDFGTNFTIGYFFGK